VKEGAKYHQGQICARELVVVVVLRATVSLLVLLETLIHVIVMPKSPPAIKFASVLDFKYNGRREMIFSLSLMLSFLMFSLLLVAKIYASFTVLKYTFV
jgi:hypothetical protein